MSGFTARSPSPNQNRTNRSGRTPESSSSLRRSVDLSHYSNKLSSPSDSSHRGSNSKHFSSQKENNERDLNSLSKSTKGRSPSPSSSSHKGFMAPTISASSKGRSPVLLPSPRSRAILSERNLNPTAQTEENFSKTDSNSDFKTEENFSKTDLKTGLETDENFAKTETKNSQVPKLVQIESEAANSLPPYDPKTNYLSPRPQYLHYKPIPRLELYKKGELDLFDVRNLEDSFSSESSESSVKTEEEESSPPSELIETEETETEAVSSEIESPETKLQVPITKATKRTKLRIAPLALIVLLIGSIFIPLSDSPLQITRNPDFKSNSSHYGGFETRLMELSNKLTHWSTHSIQYFSKFFVPEAPFPIEIGTCPLANLSSQAPDGPGNFDSNLAWPIFNGESVANDEIEAESEDKNTTVAFETVENEDVKEIRNRFDIAIIEEDDKKKEEETGFESEFDAEKNLEEIVNELHNGFEYEPVMIENQEMNVVESIEEVNNGFEPEPVKVEITEELIDLEIVVNELNNGYESESVKRENQEESINEFDTESVSKPVISETEFANLAEQLISSRTIGVIAAVAITSLVSVLLLSVYKNKNRNLKHRDSVSQPTKTPVKEKAGIFNSGSGSSRESFEETPMETSSVEFSTSFGGTKLSSGTMDLRRDSMERFARRESNVSVDSFGSFTTFEKIATKKVNGEEVTTPVTVRRSSRIRSRASLN